MCLFSAEEEEAPMVEEGHQVYLQMGLFSMGIGRGGRFVLLVMGSIWFFLLDNVLRKHLHQGDHPGSACLLCPHLSLRRCFRRPKVTLEFCQQQYTLSFSGF